MQIGNSHLKHLYLVFMKHEKLISIMSAMTFDSSPFPVAKLSLYIACSSGGGGGGGEGGNSVWQMGKSVFFVTFAQSITFESIIL